MELNNYKQIIHLSHEDLDGYGCQYITNLLKLNITYFNTSYFDVNKNINDIFQILLKTKVKTLVLITDLNISEELSIKMNNFKKSNLHIDFNYLVIDHHQTGYEVSLKNLDWYKLDINRCATYLVGQYVLDNCPYLKDSIKNDINFIMEFVDSHDRWLVDHKYHNKSNLVSGYIFHKIYYPDLIKEYKREHIFYVLKKSFEFFKNEKNTIFDFENKINKLMLGYLKNKIPLDVFKDKNICYEHKLFKYFTNLYSKVETKTFKIEYDKNKFYTFKLLFELNSEVFQYLSHYYLDEYKDINFMLNIKASGSCSFRSENDIDVGFLATKYFNGGGHKNASGGSIKTEQRFKSLEELISFLKNNFPIQEN